MALQVVSTSRLPTLMLTTYAVTMHLQWRPKASTVRKKIHEGKGTVIENHSLPDDLPKHLYRDHVLGQTLLTIRRGHFIYVLSLNSDGNHENEAGHAGLQSSAENQGFDCVRTCGGGQYFFVQQRTCTRVLVR